MLEIIEHPIYSDYGGTRDGRIWSKKRGGVWKELHQTLQKRVGGHLTVSIYTNNGDFTRQVHRLILEIFVGPCPPGMIGRHLDDDPMNNKLENLCWGTSSENNFDRWRNTGKYKHIPIY